MDEELTVLDSLEWMSEEQLEDFKANEERLLKETNEEIATMRKEIEDTFEKGSIVYYRMIMYDKVPLSWADTVYVDERYTARMRNAFSASLNIADYLQTDTEYHMGMYCEEIKRLPNGTSVITFSDPYGKIETPEMVFSEQDLERYDKKICKIRVIKEPKPIYGRGMLVLKINPGIKFISVDEVMDFGLYGKNDETKFSNRMETEKFEETDDKGAGLLLLDFLKRSYEQAGINDYRRICETAHLFCDKAQEQFKVLPTQKLINEGFTVDGKVDPGEHEIIFYLFKYESSDKAMPPDWRRKFKSSLHPRSVILCPVKALHLSFQYETMEYTIHITRHYIWEDFLINTKRLEDEGLEDPKGYYPELFGEGIKDNPNDPRMENMLGDILEIDADFQRFMDKERCMEEFSGLY